MGWPRNILMTTSLPELALYGLLSLDDRTFLETDKGSSLALDVGDSGGDCEGYGFLLLPDLGVRKGAGVGPGDPTSSVLCPTSSLPPVRSTSKELRC